MKCADLECPKNDDYECTIWGKVNVTELDCWVGTTKKPKKEFGLIKEEWFVFILVCFLVYVMLFL